MSHNPRRPLLPVGFHVFFKRGFGAKPKTKFVGNGRFKCVGSVTSTFAGLTPHFFPRFLSEANRFFLRRMPGQNEQVENGYNFCPFPLKDAGDVRLHTQMKPRSDHVLVEPGLHPKRIESLTSRWTSHSFWVCTILVADQKFKLCLANLRSGKRSVTHFCC